MSRSGFLGVDPALLLTNSSDSHSQLQVIQLNVLNIAEFLNRFDMTVRYKLSVLNEKLNKLERAVELCESAIKSSSDGIGTL